MLIPDSCLFSKAVCLWKKTAIQKVVQFFRIMNYLFIGGNSDIATDVIDRLSDAGHHIHALVRNEEDASRLQSQGFSTTIGDATKEDPVHVQHEMPQRQAAEARRTHWPSRTKLTKHRHAPNRICMCFEKPSKNHVYV